MRSGGVVGTVQEKVVCELSPVLPPSDEGGGKPEGLDGGRDRPGLLRSGDAQSIRIANSLPQSPAATAPSSEGAKGAGMCLPAGLARQNRRKLTKRGALCYDGGRRCQKRQAVSTSRKGGDAHGYIRRADPDRYFDREHLQSGLSDLQKEMTAPGQGVRSNPLIQT